MYGYNSQRNKNFACKNSIAGDYLATVTYLTLLPKKLTFMTPNFPRTILYNNHALLMYLHFVHSNFLPSMNKTLYMYKCNPSLTTETESSAVYISTQNLAMEKSLMLWKGGIK